MGWTPRPRRRVHTAVALALAVALAGCGPAEGEEKAPEPPHPPASMRGVLRVSAFGGAAPRRAQPLRHRSVFVNDVSWHGMEDVDLRGFLDGRVRYAWNQPTQTHVRAGRWGHSQRWGEYELFRVLYRVEGLGLPADARILDARLRLAVERGTEPIGPHPSERVSFLLYEVKKDFQPGEGGIHRDNTSRPREGEVWWDEVAHGREAWALPGAGYASDVDPRADTGAHALAEATWSRGQRELLFEGPALAAWIGRRVAQGRPLTLLLKASDRDEDHRASVVHFYSANVGVDRNPARRPRLELEWESPSEVAALEQRIHLEYGRRARLPDLDLAGAERVAVSFVPDPGSESPAFEIKAADAGDAAWSPAPRAGAVPGGRLALRATAARDPVLRGRPFRAGFRDTWVTSGPAEAQQVVFTFVDPEGDTREVDARFAGDFRWEVSFAPDQLGRWRYGYAHQLDQGFESAEGVFDVLPGPVDAVIEQLHDLAARLRERGDPDPRRSVAPFGNELWRLERAAVIEGGPDGFRGELGQELDAALREVRALMDEREVPPRPEAAQGRMR